MKHKILLIIIFQLLMLESLHATVDDDKECVWHCVKKYQTYKERARALQATDRKLASLGVEETLISPRLLLLYREKALKWYKKSQIYSYKLRNEISLEEKKDRSFWEWSEVLTHAYYYDHSFTRSLLRFREFYAAAPELQLRLIERTLKVLAISHRKKVQSLVRKTLNADL